MKKTGIPRYLLIITATAFMFFVSSSSRADLFGPSDLEKCKNDKMAGDLKFKYCYKDKVSAENELEALKRQYRNETTNMKNRIKELETGIANLTAELDVCRKEKAENKETSDKRIDELEKTIAILKQSSSTREKDLLDKLSLTEKNYTQQLEKAKKSLEDERERYLKELADLKKLYDGKVAQLETQVGNLTAELSSLKKLTKQQKDELDRLVSQEKELETQLKDEIQKGEIRLKKFHDKLIINIDNRISFDSGSAELKGEVLPALKKISKILGDYPENRIMIEGHTDTDKIVRGGKYSDNWQLSTERALAVLRYVLSSSNLDKARFGAAGYAEFNPIVPNDTPQNKALNRRVDIVVIPRVSNK
jgi:chemotaxis protein MotB